MWVMAKAMFSVPSVTMNGGSCTLVISPPLSTPNATQTPIPSSDGQIGIDPIDHRQPGHDDRSQRHHGAAGEIDAGSEDDQRLADGQHADHHRLLHDEREIRPGQEPVGLRREVGTRQQQREERAET